MEKENQQKMLQAGLVLPLMEAFYTIQGEGFYKGSAAYFIRLAGCNVGCHWCDVKESWEAEKHPILPIENIANEAVSHSKTIIITGGEPLMWNLLPLTEKLISQGAKTHIETSGAYPLSGKWHWVCLSPKKLKLPHTSVLQAANELKIIIYNNNDLLFAEKMAQKVSPQCQLYLQPEWSKRETITPKIVDFVLKNPQWKITLQMHKYINVP